MSKSSIDYIEKPKKSGELEIHRLLNNQIGELHRLYGLCILGGGSARSVPDSYLKFNPRYFEFYSISHLVEGRGRGRFADGREFDIDPGDLVTVSPGKVNVYGGIGGEAYYEDAIRFCGPVADMLYRSGVIVDGVRRIGRARRLLPIIELASDPARDAQINANIMLQQLLVEFYNERRQKEHSPLEEVIAMVNRDIAHWWTVAELAELAHLSEEQFRRNFERLTGKKPKHYLEEMKLKCGAEMLLDSGCTVGRAAAALGFRDAYHFAKRFSGFFGVSPGRYRQEYGRGPAH